MAQHHPKTRQSVGYPADSDRRGNRIDADTLRPVTPASPAPGDPSPFSRAAAADAAAHSRRVRVSHAAYRRAEARGFAPGHEVEDWLAAERDVDETPLTS